MEVKELIYSLIGDESGGMRTISKKTRDIRSRVFLKIKVSESTRTLKHVTPYLS